MITDKELGQIIDYIPCLVNLTHGFRGKAKVEMQQTLMRSFIVQLQSGLRENVCTKCLGTGVNDTAWDKALKIHDDALANSSDVASLMGLPEQYLKKEVV